MSIRKEIIKIRAEINEIVFKIIQKINECKNWFFEKIHKIDKIFNQTHQEKKERENPNKIRNEKEQLTSKKYKGL